MSGSVDLIELNVLLYSTICLMAVGAAVLILLGCALAVAAELVGSWFDRGDEP